MCISDGGNLWTICIKSRNLNRVGKSLDFVASCMNLHYTNWSKSNNCQIFRYSSLHVCPIHTNGFRWKTWFSDEIGKILLVTPSHGSKITGSHDGKEYRKSDKYWVELLSYGLHRYPIVGWNPMECSGKPKLRQRTDILPLAHVFSLFPTELGKILLNSQIC